MPQKPVKEFLDIFNVLSDLPIFDCDRKLKKERHKVDNYKVWSVAEERLLPMNRHNIYCYVAGKSDRSKKIRTLLLNHHFPSSIPPIKQCDESIDNHDEASTTQVSTVPSVVSSDKIIDHKDISEFTDEYENLMRMKFHVDYFNIIHNVSLKPFATKLWSPDQLVMFRDLVKTDTLISLTVLQKVVPAVRLKSRLIQYSNVISIASIFEKNVIYCAHTICEKLDAEIVARFLEDFLSNDNIPLPSKLCLQYSFEIIDKICSCVNECCFTDYNSKLLSYVIAKNNADPSKKLPELPPVKLSIDLMSILITVQESHFFHGKRSEIQAFYLKSIVYLSTQTTLNGFRDALEFIFIVLLSPFQEKRVDVTRQFLDTEFKNEKIQQLYNTFLCYTSDELLLKSSVISEQKIIIAPMEFIKLLKSEVEEDITSDSKLPNPYCCSLWYQHEFSDLLYVFPTWTSLLDDTPEKFHQASEVSTKLLKFISNNNSNGITMSKFLLNQIVHSNNSVNSTRATFNKRKNKNSKVSKEVKCTYMRNSKYEENWRGKNRCYQEPTEPFDQTEEKNGRDSTDSLTSHNHKVAKTDINTVTGVSMPKEKLHENENLCKSPVMDPFPLANSSFLNDTFTPDKNVTYTVWSEHSYSSLYKESSNSKNIEFDSESSQSSANNSPKAEKEVNLDNTCEYDSSTESVSSSTLAAFQIEETKQSSQSLDINSQKIDKELDIKKTCESDDSTQSSSNFPVFKIEETKQSSQSLDTNVKKIGKEVDIEKTCEFDDSTESSNNFPVFRIEGNDQNSFTHNVTPEWEPSVQNFFEVSLPGNVFYDKYELFERSPFKKDYVRVQVKSKKYLVACPDMKLKHDQRVKSHGKNIIIRNANCQRPKSINNNVYSLKNSSKLDVFGEIFSFAFKHFNNFRCVCLKQSECSKLCSDLCFFDIIKQFSVSGSTTSFYNSRSKLLYKYGTVDDTNATISIETSITEFFKLFMRNHYSYSVIIACTGCTELIPIKHEHIVDFDEKADFDLRNLDKFVLEYFKNDTRSNKSCESCQTDLEYSYIWHTYLCLNIEKNNVVDLITAAPIYLNISSIPYIVVNYALIGVVTLCSDKKYVAYCKTLDGHWSKRDGTAKTNLKCANLLHTRVKIVSLVYLKMN